MQVVVLLDAWTGGAAKRVRSCARPDHPLQVSVLILDDNTIISIFEMSGA